MISKDEIVQKQFTDPIRKSGKITVLVAIACLFLPGLYLNFVHGIMPPIDVLFKSLIAVWSVFAVIGFIEPIVYYPVLGFAGTYMSFLVGNVLNLRVPVAITVQELTETKPGTPEAEIISTLGIAGSLIASQLVMIIGIIALLPFIGKLQGSGTALSISLAQVLPALFGAMGGIFLLKTPKLGIVPISIGVIIALISSEIPYSVVIPPLVVISVVTARIMYKKGWLGKAEEPKREAE